jgi:hypothetical protein
MSRRVFLLGLGIALVALGLAVTDRALGPRPGATPARVQRIKPGMTVGEVETVFGRPARLIHRFAPCGAVVATPGYVPRPVPWIAVWSSDNGAAIVDFNGRDRVERAEFQPGFLLSEPDKSSSPLARLRAWLGW